MIGWSHAVLRSWNILAAEIQTGKSDCNWVAEMPIETVLLNEPASRLRNAKSG